MRELSRKYQRVRGYLALVDVMPREGAIEMSAGADVACGVLGRMARRWRIREECGEAVKSERCSAEQRPQRRLGIAEMGKTWRNALPIVEVYHHPKDGLPYLAVVSDGKVHGGVADTADAAQEMVDDILAIALLLAIVVTGGLLLTVRVEWLGKMLDRYSPWPQLALAAVTLGLWTLAGMWFPAAALTTQRKGLNRRLRLQKCANKHASTSPT